MIGIFLLLRRTLRRQYEPRTFLSSLRQQERSPPLPKGLTNWLSEFNKIPDSWVLNHQSMDGYLLLRFLKISTIICLVGCIITWPILFPVNATGGAGNQQLDILNFSNVLTPANSNRLYAHLFVAWIFYGEESQPTTLSALKKTLTVLLGFVWFMIAREMIFYINVRHAYLLSPLYANRMSARTVLFSSVPAEFLDGTMIRRLFGSKLKNYWIATDCKDLEKLVKERDKVAFKLEAAETKLIKTANNARLKATKKGGNSHDAHSNGAGNDVDGESGSVALRWITPKDRPTHKLKPLVGKKVDTINWCRAELRRLIPEVEAIQAKHRAEGATHVNSIFVEFYNQAEAQAAFQTVAHHQPLHMSPRFIGINPDEVIWSNLRIKWWERVARNYATIAFICVLIIFWAVPVAFVGVLSHIDSLRAQFSWLAWMYKIPDAIFGVVAGLLPSILLAVLMALLPIILRLMAKIGGMPSTARVELRTQNFYFAFQVVQVFLVTTLAGAATDVVPAIINAPTSAPTLLAQKLPPAGNFYISYFILQGLTFSSGALLQIVGLILFRVLGRFLDNTPRKIFKRFVTLSGLGWGTVFPLYTLLSVICKSGHCRPSNPANR